MRSTRRRDLLQILRSGSAPTQQDIVRALQARGHEVTQATVSRDLRELGAMKVRTAKGFAYLLSDDVQRAPADDLSDRRLEQFLRDFAVDVRTAGVLVVVLTPPGSANVVARAIDQAALNDVVGTIAGDDTIFVATPSEIVANILADRWLNGETSTAMNPNASHGGSMEVAQ
jgi:transcriptional regulator of arginine metabolism